MPVILIAAVANNGAIGSGNKLPWSCPVDMAHFKTLTEGKVVLMGRKTAAGLPKALPNRVNLVLTRNTKWRRRGFIPVHNQTQINKWLRVHKTNELWVIGGAALYAKYIPKADVIHLTALDIDVPNADAWFPLEMLTGWQGTSVLASQDPKVTFWTLTPGVVPSTRKRGRIICKP